jgi:hypothetical protein
MFVPFSGWAPDADPTAPGLLQDGTTNLVPTNRGYRGAPGFSREAGAPTLTATCVGLWYARRTDGNKYLYAGLSTDIQFLSGGSWVTGTGTTTVSAVDRWQFAQVGNVTIAGALQTQSMQTDSVTFTSFPAMPRFATIDTVYGFVMIGNVYTSITVSIAGGTLLTPGTYEDRWWCSGIDNYLTWTPSIATQAATGVLQDTPGPITAMRALGDRVVAYKQSGMWLMSYSGPPFIWEPALITREIGTYGQNSVAVHGYTHYFPSPDGNFYAFDGSVPKPIGDGMNRWFFSRLAKNYASKIISVIDEQNELIYWWYPGPQSRGECNEFVCLNYRNGKWGNGVATIEAATGYLISAMTWDQLWVGLTYDTVPNTTYDAANYQPDSFVPVVFDSNHVLSTLYGTQLDTTIVTPWVGNDVNDSLLRRVRARWIKKPTSAVMIPYSIMQQGDDPEGGSITVTMDQARFDWMQHARWHQVKLKLNGNWESPGVDFENVGGGRE